MELKVVAGIIFLALRKPVAASPGFPSGFPGTPEWEDYWKDFKDYFAERF